MPSSPSSTRRPNRRELFAAELLCFVGAYALWTWGFAAHWSTAGNPFLLRDLEDFFYPKFMYGAAAWARGQLRLWTPAELCGIPFMASSQVAALYPPTQLLFLLLPPPLALQVNTVLHLALAAFFAYAWARWHRASRGAAAITAAVWAGNVNFLEALYHPNRIMVAAWLPLVLLLLDRALARRTVGSAALAGLAVGLQANAG